ncbi:short-chain dehydrogenase, partial [Streptomyces sp. SID2131]|nr:short-chain dehydrogenase [Streptomyces sp. SID2131]
MSAPAEHPGKTEETVSMNADGNGAPLDGAVIAVAGAAGP